MALITLTEMTKILSGGGLVEDDSMGILIDYLPEITTASRDDKREALIAALTSYTDELQELATSVDFFAPYHQHQAYDHLSWLRELISNLKSSKE